MWIVHDYCNHFTVRIIVYQRPGNDNKNRKVFSWDLNDDNVRDDVTSGGRLFHGLAAAMGNARSQMVSSRVGVDIMTYSHCVSSPASRDECTNIETLRCRKLVFLASLEFRKILLPRSLRRMQPE